MGLGGNGRLMRIVALIRSETPLIVEAEEDHPLPPKMMPMIARKLSQVKNEKRLFLNMKNEKQFIVQFYVLKRAISPSTKISEKKNFRQFTETSF